MADTGFPKWYRIAGWLAFPFAAAFVLRMSYEESYLAWAHGPQEIGSSAHLYPLLFALGVLGLLIIEIWCVGAIVVAIRRRAQLPRNDWIQIACLGGFVLLDLVPTSWWQFVINILFGSSHP